MNKFLLLIAFVSAISTSYSQSVTVTKKAEKVRNENADGFQTELDGKRDDVSASLNKFLKEIGKSKSSGDMISINEPVINSTIYTKGILYANVTGSDGKPRVWIGILPAEWNSSDVESVQKELEQLVYRFGVKFYRDQIQLQIDEAQQASDAVDKQAQRLVNENKSLNNKLTNNEQQKVQLEKNLEENRLENLVLKQKLVNNKRAQDSIAQAAIKIKSVVDLHKERQRKVN